jgi:hypothetical protein
MGKNKTSREVYKSDIYKKPKETIGHDQSYLLDNRSMCSE